MRPGQTRHQHCRNQARHRVPRQRGAAQFAGIVERAADVRSTRRGPRREDGAPYARRTACDGSLISIKFFKCACALVGASNITSQTSIAMLVSLQTLGCFRAVNEMRSERRPSPRKGGGLSGGTFERAARRRHTSAGH